MLKPGGLLSVNLCLTQVLAGYFEEDCDMHTKFAFIERVRALFGAPEEDQRDHQQAMSPAGIPVPKEVSDADKRKHVGILTKGMKLQNQAGAIFGAGESNQSWPKKRGSGEHALHSPSNLR